MDKKSQVNINLLYGYKCNYSCHGCLTNSDADYHEQDDPDLDKLLDSIPILADTFNIESMITLIGGEPFLYWNSHIVPISLKVNEHFPKTRINIFTNGQLLGKNLDKFIDLSDRVDNITLEVTQHLIGLENTTPGRIWKSGIDYLSRHDRIHKIHDEHYHVKNNIYANILLTSKIYNWIPSLKRLPNGMIKPYASNNPAESMKHGCSAANVSALVKDGYLYKCGLLGTLDHGLKYRNQLNDPDWQKYLSYQPLDLFNFSQEDLDQYMETYGKPISECDMCSDNPKNIIKQRTYEMIFKHSP
jgi:organic radical activating enzyme